MKFNSDSRILITGGTGSFGRAFLSEILNQYPKIKRIVIYSRDELKQWELQQQYPTHKFPQLRFFLGDVRDPNRLRIALDQIDTVIHAAALKQVPAAEYNPTEFIHTNVLGAENVVRAALDSSVKNIIALSTDKAAAPINLYGATKLCSDKLFIASNNIKGSRDLSISVVRYGNVMGSRGSVIPFFINQAKKGFLPITNEEMTRFNITLKEGVEMVIWALNNAMGGEILVPKIPSYKIIDIAKAVGPTCDTKLIGIRPGEKIHEEMITQADSFNTFDLGDYYAILTSDSAIHNKYQESSINIKRVPAGFSYNSGSNPNFLNINQIRLLIKENIDPDFAPI